MTRLRCGRNLIFALNRLMENQQRREPSLEELESAFWYGCAPAKVARPPPVGLATGLLGLATGSLGLATGLLGLTTGSLGLTTGSLGLATGSLGLATGSLGLAIRAGVTTACRAMAS